jgi:hypothetical protein
VRDAERNRVLGRLRYSMERPRILRMKRAYYRKNRERIRSQQNTKRKPFQSSPARRAYMRAYRASRKAATAHKTQLQRIRRAA